MSGLSLTGALRSIAAFVYDFVIGDDWKVAASTVATVATVCILRGSDVLGDAGCAIVAVVMIVVLFTAGVVYEARSQLRRSS